MGPHRAVTLIKEHKTIENVVKHIDTKKHPIPENWPYQEARKLFKEPLVLDPETVELKWPEPDEEGIVNFLVKEKNFK